MKKRLLSILLCAVLLCALLPAAALTVSADPEDEVLEFAALKNYKPPVAGEGWEFWGQFLPAESDPHYSVDGWQWYNETEMRFMNLSEPFEEGKSYSVRCVIAPDSGYAFDGGLNVTVSPYTGKGLPAAAAKKTFLEDGACEFWTEPETAIARQPLDYVNVNLNRVPYAGGRMFDEHGITFSSCEWNFRVRGMFWQDNEWDIFEPELAADERFDADMAYFVTYFIDPDPGFFIDENTEFRLSGSTLLVDREASGYNLLYPYYLLSSFPMETRASEPEICRVSLMRNAKTGVSWEDYYVEKGAVLGDLRSYAEEGEVFLGWYLDEALTVPYDPSAPVAGDTDLYAKTISDEDMVTVCWYLEVTDEVATAGVSIAPGDVYGLPAEPAKEDFAFAGWYTDRELTTPYDPTAPIYEDTELFPKWVAYDDCFTVAIYLDPEDTEPCGGALVFPNEPYAGPAEPGKTGYAFCGWYYDRALTKPFDPTAPVTEDFELFPKWVAYDDCIGIAIYLDPEDSEPSGGALVLPNEPYAGPAEPAKDGYVFGGWYYDRELTKPFDPTAPVTEEFELFPKWIPAGSPTDDYLDVPAPENWARKGIDYCVEHGIMGSTSSNKLTFEPKKTCTRAEIASILYRLDGSPAVEYEAKFSDVPNGKWYTNAIIWAYQNGIVSGYSNGKFGPNDVITREQLAMLLRNFATSRGDNVMNSADLSGFADAGKVSPWAKRAMEWAVALKIISGKDKNGALYLDPQGNATRQEVASILMRFCTIYDY